MTTNRRRALDETKRREIAAMVAAGCQLQAAARYVGCSVRTIRREMVRSAPFQEQMRHAEAHAQVDPLRAMRKAAATHWRAAAWLLERTRPQWFARQAPGTCKPEDVERAIDACIDSAAELIVDVKLRRRVERRLVQVARESAVALRKGQIPPAAMSDADWQIRELLYNARSTQREKFNSRRQEGQKACGPVPAKSAQTSKNAASKAAPGGQNFGIVS